MSKKRVIEFFIIDILIAIDKIKRYSKDFNNPYDFYYDEKSFDATIRELQIIGEATKHLIKAELLNDEYRVIVDFRNLIVHEYFGIDADEIWDILKVELPIFEEKVFNLAKNSNKKLLEEIIKSNQKDYRGETLNYLKELYLKLI